MANNIDAYRQYLWSLFQFYSHIPNVLSNESSLQLRLSEGGYHAIMSLVLNSRVIKQFFPSVDEITLIETLRRMQSERFKNELWNEMFFVFKRLYKDGEAASDVDTAITDENKEDDKQKDDLNLSGSHDYEVMRPSHNDKTINFDVFNSVFLLRLSTMLHLNINDTVLVEYQKILVPSTQLLPVHDFCSNSEELTSRKSLSRSEEQEMTRDSSCSFSEKVHECVEQPQGTFLCWTSCSNYKDEAGEEYVASEYAAGNSEENMKGTFSPLPKHIDCNVNNLSTQDSCISFFNLVPNLANRRGTQRNMQQQQQVASNEKHSFERPFSSTAVKKRDTETTNFLDVIPNRSSPPPRPRHSFAIMQGFSAPNTVRSLVGQSPVVDSEEKDQKHTKSDECTLRRTADDARATEPRLLIYPSSPESELESWTASEPLEKKVPIDAHPNVSNAPVNDEACRRYNERCLRSVEVSENNTVRCFSPSPDVNKSRGSKENFAPVSLNTSKKIILPKRKGGLLCQDNNNTASVNVDKDAAQCRKEERQPRPLAPQSAEKRSNRRLSLPPRSLSRRALSRLGSGRQKRSDPIVPKSRAS